MQTWRRLQLDEPVLEPGHWPKFAYNFALRMPKSAWLVGPYSIFRIGVDRFVPKEGVVVPKSGIVLLRIYRFREPLPEEESHFMARCVSIPTPLEYPAPAEESEDTLQGPDSDSPSVDQGLDEDLPILEVMPGRVLTVLGKPITWQLRGLNNKRPAIRSRSED
ncbi:hypothetical protein NUW54_g12924 [Trametes sanguinea]|uniref:Uncharacterized protein n=1 Tax=Trametes sanguinea TaxID=158606 RepID=A0ACC1MRG0_9APHY|nr:hypothetical protein NUW54_g12924 [Trametes sanguinea]